MPRLREPLSCPHCYKTLPGIEALTFTDPYGNGEPSIDNSSHRWCSQCLVESCTQCIRCNAWHYYTYHPSTGQELPRTRPGLCLRCYRASFTSCARCDCVMPRNGEAQRQYCEACQAIVSPIADAGFIHNPSRRTLGIELEHIAEYDRTSAVRHLGVIKGDGSICATSARPYAFEFASKVSRGDATIALVKAACAVLKDDANGAVNSSCGYHCHVGVSDLSEAERQNLRRWWRVQERTFWGLVKQERQENQFCQSVNRYPLHHWESGGRYWSMNVAAFREHGTYEWRMHHGTLDHRRINAWASLLAHWVDTMRDITATDERIALYNAASGKSQLQWIIDRCSLPSFVSRDVWRRARLYQSFNLNVKAEAVNV